MRSGAPIRKAKNSNRQKSFIVRPARLSPRRLGIGEGKRGGPGSGEPAARCRERGTLLAKHRGNGIDAAGLAALAVLVRRLAGIGDDFAETGESPVRRLDVR